MNLREYLFRKDMKISAFANIIGYQRTYVNDVVRGSKKPGRKMAGIIEKETQGQVTVDELLNPKKSEDLI